MRLIQQVVCFNTTQPNNSNAA